MTPSDLLKSSDVCEMCGGIHAVTLKRWMDERNFPRPAVIVNRIRYWRKADVLAWWHDMERDNAA